MRNEQLFLPQHAAVLEKKVYLTLTGQGKLQLVGGGAEHRLLLAQLQVQGDLHPACE
jgi:hypothetical protein